VIAHADTKTAGNPVKNNGGDYGGPTPEKKRCDCAQVETSEEKPHAQITIDPIDLGLPAEGRGFAIF
jgi:hypothetical protein